MKYILSIIFFCLLTSSVIGQKSIGDILSSGNKFDKMVQQAGTYFQQKHPSLKPGDLARGENRDGEFVKYMRWKSYWEHSLNPDGTLGDIAAYHLQSTAQRSSSSSTGLYQDAVWTNISNSQFITLQISMGRTTSMAFHPTDADIFYVGAGIGGIWKTEDGGDTYEPLGDDLPYLAVSTIVVDQENPDIVYLSVGDHIWSGLPSIGIYKSTDAGETWNPTSMVFTTSMNSRIYWMAADPNDSSTILVATQQGLYQTTDGFDTHTQLTTSTCTQVGYKHEDSDVVYLGTNNGQFLKSTDGGTSFTLIDDFGSNQVRFAMTDDDEDKVVVTHSTTLKVSTNSGDTFDETYTLPETFQNQQVNINPKDADDYIVGYFELFRTQDGGANFTQIFDWLGNGGLPVLHVDMRNTFVNPLEDDKIYFCHDGGVDSYNVDTEQFENLSDGLIITQFYDIGVSQSDGSVISGGSQDNGSMYRDENGTWAELAGTGDGMITEIDPNNENIIFWEYQFGSMRRFNGSGNTGITPPGVGDGAWITPYRIDPSNSDRLVAGYKNVWESFDQGDNWNMISGELDGGSNMNHIAIAETDGERIYAISGSSVFVKNTNDDNWTTKAQPSGSITDIEVSPIDMDEIIVTRGGYVDGAKVYRSIDAGDTWVNISGDLPNVPFWSVEYYSDIDNAYFISSDAGVYYTDDNIEGWELYGDLPNTRARDIEIQYSDQKIRVGTYGRGVFEADIDIETCDSNSPDMDNDGTCDLFDQCPFLDDSLIGTACDDGDPLSSNEIYTSDCICGDGESNIVYCDAMGSNGTGSDWISNIQLNNLSNSSLQSGYSDFRSLSADIYEDSTYTLTMTLNVAFDADVAFAWIDYDRDGVFDTTEALSMSAFDDNDQSTGTFTVPDLSTFGATTLRVRNIWGTSPPSDPCGSYFGEVEDYTIQLMESCPQILDLSKVVLDNTNLQEILAEQEINIDSLIMASGSNLILEAGNSIELSNGTCIEIGADVLLDIGGCVD